MKKYFYSILILIVILITGVVYANDVNGMLYNGILYPLKYGKVKAEVVSDLGNGGDFKIKILEIENPPENNLGYKVNDIMTFNQNDIKTPHSVLFNKQVKKGDIIEGSLFGRLVNTDISGGWGFGQEEIIWRDVRVIKGIELFLFKFKTNPGEGAAFSIIIIIIFVLGIILGYQITKKKRKK